MRGSSQALFAMLWLPQIPIACWRLVPKFLFTIRVWLRSINIPPSLCLLLKRRLCKAWLTCLSALLFSVSSPSLSPAQHRNPPPQEAMLSQWQCAWKGPGHINCGSTVYLWIFYFNLQILGPAAKGANAQIAWAWSAEWQGLGWPFHINAMPLTSPLAGSHRKKGRWGYRLLLQEHGLYKWFVIIWQYFWEI